MEQLQGYFQAMGMLASNGQLRGDVAAAILQCREGWKQHFLAWVSGPKTAGEFIEQKRTGKVNEPNGKKLELWKREKFSVEALHKFDPKNDTSCFVNQATRFLGCGMSLLVNAATGVAKSVRAIQLAVFWALAQEFFGMRPARALRTLIIEVENGEGDVAEALQGAVALAVRVSGKSEGEVAGRRPRDQ